MIETITLITLSVLFLVFFRPGKTPPLESPLIIERVGQFRATLAPKLNLAQPLLVSISTNLPEIARADGDTNTLYFSIQDGEVKAHGEAHYLLSITLSRGLLYFVACSPEPKIDDFKTIRDASAKNLSVIGLSAGAISAKAEDALRNTLTVSAAQLGVAVTALTAPQ